MRVLPVIILAALLGGSAAHAGQEQIENWKRCIGDDPEQNLRACSALIQSGHETGPKLAKAFYDRGLTYERKGDYDHAIQDYDQALTSGYWRPLDCCCDRNPITTFASVEAFIFFPLRIARIVLRSSPVCLVVFRNPCARISAINPLFAATRPPS